MTFDDAHSPTRLNWRVIWLGWLVMVVAYTPASMIAAILNGQTINPGLLPLQVAASFLPWVPAVPLVVGLCRRFPLGAGRSGHSLLALAGTGIVILAAAACSGTALAQLLAALLATGGLTGKLEQFAMVAFATALYMLPVYATLVGIGQALVHIDRDRARERHIARARLEALRAQIEPHFLFNILNAIAALTHKDPAQADAALTELGAMLRRSLAEERDTIPLSEEIAAIHDEMMLHRLLVSGSVTVESDIEPAAGEALVAARLLRPLIENAVTHGILPAGGGVIELAARKVDRRLVIVIGNAVPAARARSGLGLGLATVREQLRVIYGDRAALDQEMAGGWFNVTLSLPLQQSEESIP